jgi:Flp pilus assembly protein TadG
MSQCHRFQKATSRRLTRLRNEQRGQSMVEFAIVLPVLLLFILGIMYFGRFEDYSNQATQLAEEGARQAAVDFNPPGTLSLQQYVLSQAQPELQAGSSDVTSPAKAFIYYPTGSSNAVGNTVRACITFTMSFSPLLKLAGPVTVTQTATMRIEQLQTAAAWTPDSTTTAAAAGCSIS